MSATAVLACGSKSTDGRPVSSAAASSSQSDLVRGTAHTPADRRPIDVLKNHAVERSLRHHDATGFYASLPARRLPRAELREARTEGFAEAGDDKPPNSELE